MSCPFCKPGIAQSVFAHSQNFRAVYNLAPIFPGHSLIIPNAHIETMLQLTDEQLTEMILFTKKVAQLLIDVFNTQSFNVSLQDREAAGQSIAHLHLHILPRRMGDLPQAGDWYPAVANNYSQILDSELRPKLSPEETLQIVIPLRTEATKRGLF
jgi:bis(5'-adenosyl)-triphosphatase